MTSLTSLGCIKEQEGEGGMLSEERILQLINEDKLSDKKRKAQEGQKYYDAVHDILNFRMFYFNADGQLVEDKIRSNSRICHPFFTELVDQEVQYMLSNTESFILSKQKDDVLQDYLDTYFDDEFISELSDVLTGAISKGFEYMYAYKGSDDRLHFQCADSLGVVEVRAKDSDDGCEYVIYWYIDRIDKNKKKIKRIQVSDKNQTWFFVQVDDGKLEVDKDEKINPRPLYMYTKDDSGEKFWSPLGFVPFFRLDNNRKQTSGLKTVKGLIDDYDLMACGLSNNLKDFDTPLHVVKGFQGDNLDELAVNLKTKKMIGVDPEGDVEIRTVDIPYQARQAKLDLDEKNIYRFGMGFNSAQLGDGNVTNVVIRSRYALLDLKCNKLEKRMKAFLKKILKVVLNEINKEHETDYQLTDVEFDFTREVMTNATDNAQIELTEAQTRQTDINTFLNLQTAIPEETFLKAVCEILDLDYDDLKDAFDKESQDELDSAITKLDSVVPDDEGGDGNEQKTENSSETTVEE